MHAKGPLVTHAEHPLEGFPELRVKDGVDDGVHTRVDIPWTWAQQSQYRTILFLEKN